MIWILAFTCFVLAGVSTFMPEVGAVGWFLLGLKAFDLKAP